MSPSRIRHVVAICWLVSACSTEKLLEPEGQFTLSPRDALVHEGGVLELDALTASDGPPLAGPVSWSSSDVNVAAVDANGLLTALAPGQTRIKASAGSSIDSILVTVQGDDGVSLEAFGNTNCGLTTTDGAVCWGHNSYGQTGTRVASNIVWTPTPVVASVTWRSLAGSFNHVCGVDTQLDVYCWGRNSLGQLGMGIQSELAIPSSRVVGGLKFITVAAGGAEWQSNIESEPYAAQQTCALTQRGEAYCWGMSGDPETTGETLSAVPRAVAPAVRFASISVGNGYACGISIDRRAWCWGNNQLGQLGRPAAEFDRAPRPIASALRFERISAGGIHACALTVDGKAWCWGANASLQVGTATSGTCPFRGAAIPCQATPVEVPGGHRFTKISAGSWGIVRTIFDPLIGYESHTCGITADEQIVCWGWNARNQITQRLDITDPLAIGPTAPNRDGLRFREVSAGAMHTCAVTVSNRGYCWGDGGRGQQGVPQSEVTSHYRALPSALVFR